MKYALVDNDNIVVNVILYNGSDEFEPPAGLSLRQINDWVNIGDAHDKQEPVSPLISDAESKVSRNKQYALKIEVVAAYEVEKKTNPNLDFSDYIDTLEVKSDAISKSL